jgi:hypothetical protein
MEDKCRVGARRIPLEVPDQLLEELLGFDLSGRVGIETAAKISKESREAQDLVRRGASKCVLTQDVARDGVEVCLRISDGFVVLHAQQPEKDLLYKIGDVRANTHTGGEKTAQPATVGLLQVDEESAPGIAAQSLQIPKRFIPQR